MYGLVNKALEELVISKYGEDIWERIKTKAEVDVIAFINNEPYPDEITYKLVSATADLLNLTRREVLIAFGEHWVLKTALDNYGALLRSGARNIKEFLLNLHGFHARVQLIFPGLMPPTFYCTDVTDTELHLHYVSQREALSDFVEGLLQGLAKLFDTSITIQQIEEKKTGADHDVFRVSWPQVG